MLGTVCDLLGQDRLASFAHEVAGGREVAFDRGDALACPGCGDGREIIDEGKVTLTGPFLIVYEKTEFEAGNAEPKLVVNLNFMSAVTMRRFHSAGRNFAGGRIALEGAIDRAFAEKLVMKMELSEYKRMKAALRVALPRHQF